MKEYKRLREVNQKTFNILQCQTNLYISGKMSDNHGKIDEDQFKRMIDIDTEYARRNPNTFDNLPGTKPVQNFFIQKSLFQKSFQIGS